MELEQVYQTAEDVKAEKNQSQPLGRFRGLEELGWEEFTEGLTDVHLAAVVGGKHSLHDILNRKDLDPCCSN